MESIVNQTYNNITIKIFDNASEDNSSLILREYEERYSNIKVYWSDKNIGLNANFTKCIENFEGEYSAIYHTDDVYDSEIIEKSVKALEKNEISVVFSKAYQINSSDMIVGREFTLPEFNGNKLTMFNFNELFDLVLKYENFLVCPSAMAKTELYKNRIKKWRTNKFKTSADLDVWLRMSKYGHVGIINEFLIKYRHSTASFTYNRGRCDTSRHDLFLVLDYYIKNFNMSKSSWVNYDLLLLKDDAQIILNKMINKQFNINNYRLNVFNITIFIAALNNRKIFKYYLFALLLRIVILFRLQKNETVVKYLYKTRYNK